MPKIDIDSATGMPIVVSDAPNVGTSGTTIIDNFTSNEELVKLAEDSKSNSFVIPKDAVPSDELKKEPTGMANKIGEAVRFNSELASSVNEPKINEPKTEKVQTIDKDIMLRNILKQHGMDTQQQGKAFAEIKALFSE